MRISLRIKLLFFSVIIAVIPLFIAGRSMIRMTQDELKSSANESISSTATELGEAIDERYQDVWMRPLELVRNAIDSDYLSPQEKLSILRSAIQEIADVVALQLTVEGIAPALVSKEAFTSQLDSASVDASTILRIPEEDVPLGSDTSRIPSGLISHIPVTDDWLTTIFFPLENGLLGRRATLSARIDLSYLREGIEGNPMNLKGEVSIVDRFGIRLLGNGHVDLSDRLIVRNAVSALNSNSRATSVFPYTRTEGAAYLGALAFPQSFPWAVVVEMREEDAYLAVAQMRRSLWIWVLIGLGFAAIGAVFVALRISKPILKIGEVTQAVSRGDLHVRVEGIRSKDEIGDLADRVNEMIRGLIERFNLEKFVSGGTIAAVKNAEDQGIRLGGERRRVTVLFSDIRGFTAFSEKVEPEVVVDMLNTYLRHQAYIVRRYHGDIDKYVGDELLAVFQGEDMELNAIRCSVEIQRKMQELALEYPDWSLNVGIGINTGDVVMGAMGSEERMDYTILGDTVNLGARLCSKAGPAQTLISSFTFDAVSGRSDLDITALPPISVKGKSHPIDVLQVNEMSAEADAIDLSGTAMPA